MRAVVLEAFGTIDKLGLKEVPEPAPGPGEVLIEVHAAGVTFANLLVVQGKYQVLPDLPFTPGREIAGRVRTAGAGARAVRPGDRVMAMVDKGGFAELAVGAEADCHVIPEDLSFVDAVALGNASQTAYLGLFERAALAEGETVLVNGAAGGVGLAAVELAKAKGATVLAGLATPQKAAVARACGADHVIDLAREDLKDSLREQVFAVTDGRGADVVLDMIGGDVFDASLRALAWGGRLVVVGFASGRIPTVRANYLLIKNIAVLGLYSDTYRRRDPEGLGRAQAELFALCAAGRITPRVMRTFPLEGCAEALALIAGRKVEGRLILTPRARG